MSHQTYIERLAAREAAVRARARSAAVIDDDDGVTPVVAARGAARVWTVGSTVAGRFVLLQRLGRGRYGPIYKALDRSLSEGVEPHVALHELDPRIETQATLLERLAQQSIHPQSWSHPNLAKLLEFGRYGGKFFLLEELLEGASLRLVLDESAPEPLEHHEVLGVLRSVGDALSYVHAKGVVHGDLRPESVFVTHDYTVKLLGVLPCSEPRPAAFYVEDLDSGGRPHLSDDVYGVACLAYELLTGRHPYNGKSPLDALRAGLEPPAVPALPRSRWEALSRGLALARELRPASVPELLAGLGVTGTETLQRAEDARPTPARAVEPAVRAPAADARRDRDAAAVRAADAFATMAFYAEPSARAVRGRRSTRRSTPVRTALGATLAAALAVLVYLDHARLRLQAGDLMETATAFASQERARWQARLTAPKASVADIGSERARPRVSAPAPSAATAASESAVAAASTTEPKAGVPAEATAGDAAVSAIAPEAVVPKAHDAADARPAPLPASPSFAAAAPVAAPRFEFAARTVTVSEREASVSIVIRRTGSLDAEAAVVWWAADRTALADEDYAVLGARIESFAAGEQSRTVHIPLVADSIAEGPESFFVHLGADRAGSGAAVQLEVVVLDDDS